MHGVARGPDCAVRRIDGTLVRNAAVGEKARNATSRLQRELEGASERDDSGRVLNRQDPKRRAAALRLARSREHEKNARLGYAHKAARKLVDAAAVIALEALCIRNMTRSAKGTAQKPRRNVAAKSSFESRHA
jgi:transposase